MAWRRHASGLQTQSPMKWRLNLFITDLGFEACFTPRACRCLSANRISTQDFGHDFEKRERHYNMFTGLAGDRVAATICLYPRAPCRLPGLLYINNY